MRLGVHISIKDGFVGAAKCALETGCEGFQMFVGNPRGWSRKPLPEKDFEDFKDFRSHTGLWPVVVHLAYLPNPASEDTELYEKSVLTLAEDFGRANALGADFFVLHPGKSKSPTGWQRVAQAVNLVLDQIKGPTLWLFENQAGMGSEIATQFSQLARLIAAVKDRQRVGICFDTCHGFAAGYDLSSPAGWEATLQTMEQELGWEMLKLFHLNDCMGELGSKLDRHQHIGQGQIGLAGFEYLVNHPHLCRIPGILETPQQNPGDDRRNLETLRQLVRKG